MSDTSPLVEKCKKAGYKVEKDAYADDTSVVSFPVKEENFSKSKSDVSIWEQFANAADLQKYWADNQVSITVTFQNGEHKEIATCLEIYETSLKSISLLPLLEGDHGYVQAPYVKIDEETYNSMISSVKSLNLDDAVHEVTEKFCDGDSCTL